MAGENETVDRGDDFTPTDDAVLEDAAPVVGTKAEPEAVGEKIEAAEQPRDDKGKFIPKSRFDEAVTKEREAKELAQRQIQELQKQLQSVSRSADTATLETQLNELRKADRRAIMDGNEEKSIEIAAQIDRINRQIVLAESQSMSAQATEEAREGIRVETAIERLEEIYPVLKEGTETFDQGLVDLVLATQQQLMARDRMPPSQALTKAANDIMVRFQTATKADEKPAGGLGNAKGADRTAAAKGKAVDAALRTPPDTRDVGLDTDKAGMKDGVAIPMTIEELAAIPTATLKRMRGDMA
jgi:hypothetical protein